MTDMDAKACELPPERLKRRCIANEFGFHTTDELRDDEATLPHQRALSGLELALNMSSAGHNVYVMGMPGSGRHAAVRRHLERAARSRPPPDDWCYLNRFDDPQRPRALHLPPGRGTELKTDMRELMRELSAALPQVLDSEPHRKRRTEVEHEFEQRAQSSIEAIQREAEEARLGLIQAPDGLAVAPMRDGEPLPREEFDKLPSEEQQRLRQRMEAITEKVREHVNSMPRWHRDCHRRLRDLDREALANVVRVHIEELRAKYTDRPEVLDHLSKLEADLVENASGTARGEPNTLAIPGLERPEAQAGLSRYDVNVLIDSRALAGAPVIYEGNPTYQNLVGQVENIAQFGMLRTDFTLVRAGALHRANGGFLILDAERLLAQPFAWEALKHALFEQSVRIESLGQHLSLISTVALEPDPIPLAVRVVLIGGRYVYDLLCQFDPEFAELFKVASDFDDEIERNSENTQLYARIIASTIRREGLKHFEASAVARLIEQASRLAGDSRKLSTHLRSIEDAVREASHFAGTAGQELVRTSDVQRALDEQLHRLARPHTQTLEAIRTNALLIDCHGEAIGQVNGLSVARFGQIFFGQPSRITACVRIGTGDVIDIEREVKLGGSVHSKGVLILAALVGSRFGARTPLSLHASLVFEQSYGGVEGDSASLAETCALLSAIAQVPLRQSVGVTGSINQHGAVQVIGGVNEKVEGFFDTCRERGLTGSQGVILPAGNVPHLMLRDDVIAAVERGSFHIYAVRTLDEAITLLTGLESGKCDPTGAYPEGSFNARVEHRLREFARDRQEFAREALSGDLTRSRGA